MNPFFNLARLKNRLGRRTRPGGGKLARRNDLRARRRAREGSARAKAAAARARNDDDGRERRADAPRRGCDDATRRG